MGVDHEIAYCEEARNEPAKKPTSSRKPKSKKSKKTGENLSKPKHILKKKNKGRKNYLPLIFIILHH